MNVKTLFLALAAGVLASSCNSGSMNQTKADLKSSVDSASYFIGYMYGNGLQRSGFTDLNRNALMAGMNTGIKGDTIKMSEEQISMYLNMYFQKLSEKKAEENMKKGEAFLQENAKKEGVKMLTDGIQYKVLTEGTGEKPAATDMVKVNYRGTLIDGKEFDSSYKRGEPIEFQLDRMIPGWVTALQQMPVGSKWMLYLPAEQGYGQRGGGMIEPNSPLIFEIELLEIVKPEAAPAESAK